MTMRANTNRFLYEAMLPYVAGKRTLDIGCGDGAYSGMSKTTVRLDMDESFDPDIVCDLRDKDLPFADVEFECTLILEVLEYVDKARALEVLRQCKRITSGRIYILSPLWHDVSIHHSKWSLKDFDGWERMEFGNYFFGHLDFYPGWDEVKVDSPQSAQIRSSFGYNTGWDY